MCRGLLYCMEYLEESLSDWLGEELQVLKAPTLTPVLALAYQETEAYAPYHLVGASKVFPLEKCCIFSYKGHCGRLAICCGVLSTGMYF